MLRDPDTMLYRKHVVTEMVTISGVVESVGLDKQLPSIPWFGVEVEKRDVDVYRETISIVHTTRNCIHRRAY